ncbi:hypothetical protein Tco_1392404 [Tanacetum coccineum]
MTHGPCELAIITGHAWVAPAWVALDKLGRDDREAASRTSYRGLNELITQAEQEIEIKEAQIQVFMISGVLRMENILLILIIALLGENTNSTNEAVNTVHEVSNASSQGQASSSTYADDVMFSFFANQCNSSQLDNEDLEQIDNDDLEEMDIKWQVAMLTMRVKRFLKKTGKNLNFNGKETGNRNRDAPRRNALMDTSTANALVVQDGIGSYDWSFQAEEGITNFALMAYTSQGYQMGLESLEARIVIHEKNEAVYEEDIPFLNVFNTRESDVDDSPINNRFKIGEGFHAVPPPYTRNYMPSRPNLSFVGLDDFVYKTSKDIVEKPKTVRPSAPSIEDWDTNSDNDIRRAFNQKSVAETNNLNEKVKTAKVNNVTTTGPKAVVSAAKGNGENTVKSSAC